MMTKLTKARSDIVAPSHLGLIPDGNRRWSQSRRLTIRTAYQNGIKKLVPFGIWAKGFGVKTLTVWALSSENIKQRSRLEMNTLYTLFVKWASDPEIISILLKNSTRVKIIGNLNVIPKKVRAALVEVERKTMQCGELTINLLVGYGGREDMVYALKNASRQGNINEEDFRKNMISASLPDLDLIIRTSGERRLSGFLPWQASYSEIYFARKYWPDFNKNDLKRAIKAFSSRERRFGR